MQTKNLIGQPEAILAVGSGDLLGHGDNENLVMVVKSEWQKTPGKSLENGLKKHQVSPLDTKLCQLAMAWFQKHQKTHLLLVMRGGRVFLGAADQPH